MSCQDEKSSQHRAVLLQAVDQALVNILSDDAPIRFINQATKINHLSYHWPEETLAAAEGGY